MPPARQVVAPAKAGAESLPLARTERKLLKSRDSRLKEIDDRPDQHSASFETAAAQLPQDEDIS